MDSIPEPRVSWWQRVLSLDLRSLAIFRIGLGLFTAGDVMHRLVDIRALYMDEGALPRSAVTGEFGNHWQFSVHLMLDALWFQLLLFFLCAAAGLALAIGYRTWIATLVGWVLVVSLQNRNEAAIDGGDMVQRLLLFWSLFLPLNAIWSVDALRREGDGSPSPTPLRPRLFGIGSVALTIQMASIFFFAALLKTGSQWRRDFSAVWYTLNWDVYTTPIGIWMRQFHTLLSGLTVGTLVLEGIFPLLLFVPWAPLRVFVLLSLISLHAGFVVAMKLFMFAAIMSLGWFSLMPGWFWEKLGVPMEMNATWRARFARLSGWLPVGGGARPWTPLEKWPRFTRWVAAFCLIYVCCWNIRTVVPSFIHVFPSRLNALGFTLRIDQYWIMFAPAPVSEDGWFVVPGRLADGRLVDVFRDGAPVTWERPELIADHYINRRWRTFLWNVTRANRAAYRKYYAAYLCHQWDRNHEDALDSFDIVLMHEESKPDYTVTPVDKMVLMEGYRCRP